MRRFVITAEIDITHHTVRDALDYVGRILGTDFDDYDIKHVHEVRVNAGKASSERTTRNPSEEGAETVERAYVRSVQSASQ